MSHVTHMHMYDSRKGSSRTKGVVSKGRHELKGSFDECAMSYKSRHNNKRPRNTPTHIYTCGCIPYDLHVVSQSQTTRVMRAALMCIPTATPIHLPTATLIRVSRTHCNTHLYSHCNTHSCLTYPLQDSFECETITAVGLCDTNG